MSFHQRFFHTGFAAFLAVQALSIATLPLADAAKKYYPPGFEGENSPQEPSALPASSVPQQAPQVIIKTVPVAPKPRDPLTVLLEEQRYYEAQRLLDRRIQQSPNNLHLRLLRAQVLRKEENFKPSLAEYRYVLAKTRTKTVKAQAYNGMGWTAYANALRAKQLGDSYGVKSLGEEAEKNFRQALQFNPRLPQAWAGLAQCALSAKKLSQAEGFLKKAVQYGPDDLSVELAQAELLLAQDKAAQALPLLYKAKRQAPRDSAVFLLLGQASLAMNRADDAIIQLKQLLEISPGHTEALKLLSAAYEGKMKPEDAETALQKVIALNPEDVETARALLKIYDQRGEGDRDILFLQNLLSQCPRQEVYQLELMNRLIRAERWNEAYENGLVFVGLGLENPALRESATFQKLADGFAQAVYVQGRGKLDRTTLLDSPKIKAVTAYYQDRLAKSSQDLNARLDLLLLNPLSTLPALPAGFTPTADQTLTALQVAYLQGQGKYHQELLGQMADRVREGAFSGDAALAAARSLLFLRDYAGARLLAEQLADKAPSNPGVAELLSEIQKADAEAREQLLVLDRLPGKIPMSHWEKTAQTALELAGGNWKLHELLADTLRDRRQYAVAYTQQMLAARYAPTSRERERLLKQAEKTRRKIRSTP